MLYFLPVYKHKGKDWQMVTLLEGDLDPDWLDSAMNALAVGCDIETSGLNRNTDRIATFQMYVPDVGVVMVRKLKNPMNIVKILEEPFVRKIFHYAPFDLGFLMRDYPYLYPDNIADTKVAAAILDPSKQQHCDPITGKGSHSLKTLVHIYFGFEMDKTLAVSNWFARELKPEQLDYAAKDVEYLPSLLVSLETQLKTHGLLKMARKAYNHIPTKVMLDLKGYSDVYGY